MACKVIGDDREDTIGIGLQVIVGEAEDIQAAGMKVAVARCIALGGGICEVGVAVDLDDETGVEAGEVGDVGAEGDLLAEVVAGGAERTE